VGFECYRIGDLALDAGTQEVTRNGEALTVPRLSFKLLLSLARHAPNVVSIQQLEKEVWAGLVVDKGTVNKRVLLLRKAIGDEDPDNPYIAVSRGRGYRLVCDVELCEQSESESVSANAGLKNWYQRSSVPMRLSYWLLAVVVLLALYHGYEHLVLERVPQSVDSTVLAENLPAPVVYEKTSIAVLPFVDLSEVQAHQFIGDGVAEEILRLLSGMEGLKVAARTSSFTFRDSASTTPEIARYLKVGSILEGSVSNYEDRIKITVQLIDAQTGYSLWSQQYDCAMIDIFDVQDEIAISVASFLELSVTESNRPDSGLTGTDNMEAFAYYLKGRELFNDRIHLRAEGLRDALSNFKKAVESDSRFAKAYASLALTYRLLASYDPSLDRFDYYEHAEEYARFALGLDPTSVDALAALATVYSSRGEFEKALVEFEKIRAMGVNDSNIAHWEAMMHIQLGYFDEVIKPLQKVLEIDPLNEYIAWILADAFTFTGEPEAAAQVLEQTEHFRYQQYMLGLTAINSKDYVRARELLRDVRMRSGILPATYADLIIDALQNPVSINNTAQRIVAAVTEGELDKLVGFEALLVLGSPVAFDLDIDPVTEILKPQLRAQVWNNWSVALRQDSRFKDWVRKLGYVKFWEKHGWPDRCGPTTPGDFECI